MKKILLSILSILLVFAGASALRAENVGVPAECEDVMLQAFYWDSYKTQTSTDSKYGRTKWVDLRKDSIAICNNFDLIWLPPSAFGGNGEDANAGGVGYIPKNFTNQTSAWGQGSTLEKFIATMHRGGTKVIADIVINHHGNSNSWCTFYPDNFGAYGSYQLTSAHICKNDEVNSDGSAGSCKGAATGANDSGTNFEGARDLDHTNSYVQEWSKAYVKWMKNVMKYDGFRYDMTRGFKGEYLGQYNEASQPYLSVSEYWMDDVASQVSHLKATGYNTMVFDFAQRSKVNNALKYPNYRLLTNHTNSFRYQGLSRYAVTFIDNHDTFERSDNKGAEFIGYGIDITNASNKRKILQANAYILLLPGIPCVFYPHWVVCKDEISALIAVRKAAGIHSESTMSESADQTNNTYEATIQGHRGSVILRMGVNRSKEVPEGYELAIEGGSAAEYTVFIAKKSQDVENVSGALRGEKFVEDGKLLIRRGEHVYDVLGRIIK